MDGAKRNALLPLRCILFDDFATQHLKTCEGIYK